MCAEDFNSLIDTIYPDIGTASPPPPEYFKERMILAPRNLKVGETNHRILDMLAGEHQEYYSFDEFMEEQGVDGDRSTVEGTIPLEFVRDLDIANFPPGVLRLKVGCPVILLRNLNPGHGLCNGTRLIITRLGERIVEARILGGEHDGDLVLVPRIALTPNSSDGLTRRFRRKQFPIRLAFALSINKSQGQSVKYVGIDLTDPVFSHGQLYVALSRVTARSNLRILLPDDTPYYSTPNIVYPEILLP